MEKHFIVTISADDNISKVYPNFRLRYEDDEDFINSIADDIRILAQDSEGVESFGYHIKVVDFPMVQPE